MRQWLPALRGLARACPSASTPQLRPYSNAAGVKIASDTIPLRTGRPRLVVLGTGWAAARLLRDIDPKLYDLTVRCLDRSARMPAPGWRPWPQSQGCSGMPPPIATQHPYINAPRPRR